MDGKCFRGPIKKEKGVQECVEKGVISNVFPFTHLHASTNQLHAVLT